MLLVIKWAKGGVTELKPYPSTDSFRNKTRMDYGRRAQDGVLMFLRPQDRASLGVTRPGWVRVFSLHLDLCRELQTVYRMEPAGSMGSGTWTTISFVSFIWGAAQLSTEKPPRVKPKAISDSDMADAEQGESLFACLLSQSKVGTLT